MPLTGVQEMKAMLMEELSLIIRTTSQLIRVLREEDWAYRPRENMMSVEQLAQHLVAIPAVDLMILQEHTQEEVHVLEAEAASCGHDADKLAAFMETGSSRLRDYMESLDDDTFLHKRTTPFYLEHSTAQAKWLIEIVTHTQHHRAQLFNYLKELGHPVSMFNLYG